MTFEQKIDLGVEKFLKGEGTLTLIRLELGLANTVELSKKLSNLGYEIYKGAKLSSIIGLKKAVDEYIKEYDNNPSLSKISKKYKIGKSLLARKLKSLGYQIVNHQNKVKFNEHVFDVIDTEEKAYWLGFIYADGWIALDNDRKAFELSLSAVDVNHLYKFNKFMQHIDPNHVKVHQHRCFNTGKSFERCRWGVRNKHLWETLNSYGCTPRKSLTLEFPKKEIFKDESLIRHFIRGYFDGDGCLSYADSNHTRIQISALGTQNFLEGIKLNLPIKFDYKLSNNNSDLNITKVLHINGKNAFEICYYLYNDSTIHLDRKYEKYLEYCRLYKELYIILLIKNGKIRIDDSVLNLGFNIPKSVLSVESEPK